MVNHLRLIPCLAGLIVAAGCGGGTDVRIEDSGSPIPLPTDGITGIALKGAISGGTVTVTDASGATLEIREGGLTQARGRFAVTFSEATVSGGITAPMTVTVQGGETTCDIDRPDTTEDCPQEDDQFIAFGERFPLPETFTLRGTLARLPDATNNIYTVNVSPASDLATNLAERQAEGTALTSEEVEAAEAQVLALIESLSGIPMNGASLVTDRVFDITSLDTTTDGVSDQSWAIMAFASAVLSELDPDDTDVDTMSEVFERIRSELSVDDDGNLVATGTTLSRLSSAMVAGLQTVNLQLAGRGASRATLDDAEALARQNTGTFALIGNEDVTLGGTDTVASNIAMTRVFINSMRQGNVVSPADGTITDGNVTLTLTGDPSGGMTGSFTVGTGAAAQLSATLDSQGVVHYADGAFETLPPDAVLWQ